MLCVLLCLDNVAQTAAALAAGVAAFAGGRQRTDLALSYRFHHSISPYKVNEIIPLHFGGLSLRIPLPGVVLTY